MYIYIHIYIYIYTHIYIYIYIAAGQWRTVDAGAPSAGVALLRPSVVKCLWEVFVWGFGVLFLSCACVCRCRGCCSLSVYVCV